MNILHNQKGSTHIVALLGVLVIAVAGFAGYRIMEAGTTDSPQDVANTTSAIPSEINSSADVNKTSEALDDTPIDGSINPNQLDEEITAVL